MATSVGQAFTEFRAGLELTEKQQSGVSAAHNNLRKFLRGEFTVVNDFLTGSYVRSTMIRPSRDVDIFLVLHPDYYNGSPGRPGYGSQVYGPSNLLTKIKTVLQKQYPKSEIGQNGQAVTVWFELIDIDVVPAFARQGGGYLIPNTPGNNWLSTDPAKHGTATSGMNVKHAGRFVPLVKMIKYWNYSHSFGLSGFFLEMLAYDIFKMYDLPANGEGIKRFFEQATRWLDNGYTVPDTATGENLVHRFLNTDSKRATARNRFAAAYALANQACDATKKADAGLAAIAVSFFVNAQTKRATAEQSQQAIELWRQLFGPLFPTYG